MKAFKISRICVFYVSAILVFIFREKIANPLVLNYVIGGIMLLFGVDALIEDVINKSILTHHSRIAEIIVLFVLGFTTIFLSKNNLYLTCIIWSIWSIDRESIEMSHKIVHNFDHKISTIVNIIESIAVIALSIMLITNPEHHVHSHILLLSIELILEVTWELINKLEDKIRSKKVAR